MPLINDNLLQTTSVSQDQPDIEEQFRSPGYDVAQINLDPADTVEGRVARMAGKDSTLNILARTGATQTANKRGLVNSSIAAGAGEKAVLQSVLPIAQQDSQTMFNTKAVNQQAVNQMKNQQLQGTQQLMGIDAQGKQERLNIAAQGMEQRLSIDREAGHRLVQIDREAGHKLVQIGAQGDQNLRLADREAVHRMSQIDRQGEIDSRLNAEKYSNDRLMQDLDHRSRERLAALEVRANAVNQRTQTGGLIYAQGMTAISNILSNPDITPEAKKRLVDEQMKLMDSSMAFTEASSNVDSIVGPVEQRSGPRPTDPNYGVPTGFDDMINVHINNAGALNDQAINASLQSAIDNGISPAGVYAGLSKHFPGVPYGQFVDELTARGFKVDGSRLTR